MDYQTARENMVENQVRTNNVTDMLVISTLKQVPREIFIPKNKRYIPYLDDNIAIGNGRYTMQPMVIGRIMQYANIQSKDITLIIGSGLGYTSALFSCISGTVIALESNKIMAQKSDKILQEARYDNVIVVENILKDGYPKYAPYNIIIFDGAISEVPQKILNQLAEKGRLLAIIHSPGKVGITRCYERIQGKICSRDLFETNIAYLPEFVPKETFCF